MSYLPGCTATQRRALVRLRMKVENAERSDFDLVDGDGTWFCPRLDHAPNYGPWYEPTPRTEAKR